MPREALREPSSRGLRKQDVFLILLVVAAGIAAAFQGPINASLARRTGPLEAAFISFTGGALVLAAAVAFAGAVTPRRSG